MLMTLRHWWEATRSSFWFVPAVIVLGAVALAIVLIAVDATVALDFVDRWPLFFGAGAAGSRGLLMAVASLMITVAGVVFSITIVALALTSSQYTSRVLRNFMRDRSNQIVLGVFVGIFAYCLVVLRTIRSGDEGAFVPSLAVLVGLILAFVDIAYLIFFIHHIARSIQASSINAAAARETIAAVDHLFPNELGEDAIALKVLSAGINDITGYSGWPRNRSMNNSMAAATTIRTAAKTTTTKMVTVKMEAARTATAAPTAILAAPPIRNDGRLGR